MFTYLMIFMNQKKILWRGGGVKTVETVLLKSTETRRLTDTFPHADTWLECLEHKYNEICTKGGKEGLNWKINGLENRYGVGIRGS